METDARKDRHGKTEAELPPAAAELWGWLAQRRPERHAVIWPEPRSKQEQATDGQD
ncbi:hypothetical protein GCM10027569_75960 [Flindersiella endophytica]